MIFKSKIKFFALVVLILSVTSMLVHLIFANYSVGDFVQYKLRDESLYPIGQIRRSPRLWGPVTSLEALQPYSSSRNPIPVAREQNGFIYAKISGGFDKIRSAICDLVVISKLLNATLVIPEIQENLRSKGVSSKFKSFSYIYNEDHFIDALSNDVSIVKYLPEDLKGDRKNKKIRIVSPRRSAAASFYIREVLPMLRQSKAVGFSISNGGCLESILPPSMVEYQRLRCRVAFHALQFRKEIQALGDQILGRLRALGRPYLAFHPGLVKDTLAFHGCAELFQDVHAELIQYRRAQMIKRRILNENLGIDSVMRKRNGSCPLMPEEVGLLLRAMGYPPSTIIYVAGSETFGGQRVLIPLRAMYANVVDRSSFCTDRELSILFGPETPIPSYLLPVSQEKSEEELIEEWNRAGPRPRPLPPPPSRPFYRHEKEGWYGWVAETDREPDPSPMDLRMQAHRLIFDALDYYVSVEADAFFPGFHNDGKWPDFSGLVMGHRLYKRPSLVTYRPNRRSLVELFDTIRDHMYHPKRNWTASVREQLGTNVGVDGLVTEAWMSKPTSFLSHPLPECSCRTSDSIYIVKGPGGELLYGGEDECPESMKRVRMRLSVVRDEAVEDNDFPEDSTEESNDAGSSSSSADIASRASEQPDEEMDPDD